MMDIKTHYCYTKHTANGEDIWLTPSHLIFSTSISVGKDCACNAGDPASIPGLGRSLGEGKGYPLQYSGLQNSMGVTKRQTQLSDFHFHFSLYF